jgi:hypothetical protein
MTAYSAALKVLYSDAAVANEAYQDNPFLQLVKKDTNFVGKQWNETLIYGNPMGVGPTIAAAQSAKAASSLGGFALTRSVAYETADLGNEAILASATDKGSMLQVMKTEIDGAINNLGRRLAIDLMGDGTGVIGTVGSGGGGTTLTLSNPDQITNFDVNLPVAFFTDTTGQTAHGNTTVTAVDRNAGTIKVAAAGSIANGDVIVVGSGTSGSGNPLVGSNNFLNNVVKGLGAWLPQTAPSTGDSFFGQDRSLDTTRLAGVRTDGRNLAIDEALVNAARDVGREGGAPDYGFMDFLNWGNLVKILGAQVRYLDPKDSPKPGIGFQAVLLNGPKGVIKIVPDRNCAPDRSFLLTMKTWTLRSLKQAPFIIQTDDQMILRNASADSFELRVAYYAQLGCSAPAYNCNLRLA